MTRFTDYQDQLDSYGGGVLSWRHDLVAPSGEMVFTTVEEEVAGSVEHWSVDMPPLLSQSNRRSRRTATIEVPISNPDLLPSVGSPLHPDSGNRVVTSAGLVGADGVVSWQPQGSMVVDEASATSQGGVAVAVVDLVDPMNPLRADLVDSFTFEEDETVGSVCTRLAEQVLQAGTFDITEGGGCTVPGGSLGPGTNRLTIIQQLLEGCGHELHASAKGYISARPIPPSDDNEALERWVYGTGRIPVHSKRRVWQSRVPQAWEIQGGSFRAISAAPTVLVFDQDPSSEGYYQRPGVRRVGSTRLPFVRSVNQGITAGYGQLRRYGVGPMVLVVEMAPNPYMQEGDLIAFTDSEALDKVDASGTFRVLDYRLPVQLDGLMEVTMRAVYNPALGYVPPADRGEGCVVSIADSFDRPNQNLEDLEGSPGSTDWTERGFSWGIEGQRAVQRYANGWSLAYLNTPLCSSDQAATVDIAEVPSGRQIGPMVRSSGEFDGYAAIADSNGVVRLEMWQAGSRKANLGQHNSGGSMADRSLTIQAVGQQIEVSIQGTTVITASDDRRTGTYVGMIGYGGPSGSAPAAESFTAGVAS